MDIEGGSASRKRRKTFFTDQYGQKKVICHECGHRKPRSTYYDTCYRGIDCTPPPGYEAEHTQATSNQPPNVLKSQAAKRLLDNGGQHDVNFMQSELHKQQVRGRGADELAAKGLAQAAPLVGGTPLTPLVLKEQGSLQSQKVEATTVKSEGDRSQVLAEGSLQEQQAAAAPNHLESAEFAPLECSDMAHCSGEKSEHSESEEQSISSLINGGEDEVSAETYELAMEMLQKFNELGDGAACSDVSDDEAEEQAENIEAAAAYLCKQLKQGRLAGMEDEEDEGDDWPYKEQHPSAKVSFFPIENSLCKSLC